jgi:PAS domain S-box-containing protein
VLDTPISRGTPARDMLRIAGAAGLLIMSVAGLKAATQLADRKSAAAEKPAIQSAIDASDTFGRVVVDASGTIKSWNRGMTLLTGWQSKEMVAKTADRLDPRLDGAEALTFSRVFSRRELPWVARGIVLLRHRDGELIEAVVSVRDLAGGEFREINFDHADQL